MIILNFAPRPIGDSIASIYTNRLLFIKFSSKTRWLISTLVGNSNDPPRKYCILGNHKRLIDQLRLVKTGQNLSKLVESGQNLSY